MDIVINDNTDDADAAASDEVLEYVTGGKIHKQQCVECWGMVFVTNMVGNKCTTCYDEGKIIDNGGRCE